MFYYSLFIIIIILIIIKIIFFLKYVNNYINKYFLTKEINLLEKYGPNTWVLITGCSSGQGEMFAYEFAKRNFNLIMVGNEGIIPVKKDILKKYKIKIISYITDFRKAYKKNYFIPIEKILDKLDGELSILVNNIGHRVAWEPYHEMPETIINDTIICGTIVQARLTQIAIKKFIKRSQKYKSCIINMTSMCVYPSLFFGRQNHLSVPYLSAYEGANAFGFYHSNSIQKEYEKYIDVLNITPGAVITKNTSYLKDVLFSIKCEDYVKNIFTLIGNYTGPQHAYWKHELSGILCNLINIHPILFKTGKLLAKNYMKKYTT